MSFIAAMQGRLSPPEGGRLQAFPTEGWKKEFLLASQAGLDGIEWIYDVHGEKINPLKNAAGILEMKCLTKETGIKIRSVCADYFVEKPLVSKDSFENEKHFEILELLIERCAQAGLSRIVLPFVDASAIAADEQKKHILVRLNKLSDKAKKSKLEIHLETSLNPEDFKDFLSGLPEDIFKVNYDTGNSASLGYSARKEFEAYGSRIGSVHIKDRRLKGGTVPLGEGDADFKAIFSGLKSLSYHGDFILQVARSVEGEEVRWAMKNKIFVKKYWAG